MQPPEQLETDRLFLRRPRREYAPLVFAAYAQDSEVTRYLTWRPHASLRDSDSAMDCRLAGWETGAEFSWFLFTRESDELVGSIAARVDGHRINLGFVLARSQWGRGLMTEAVTAVVQWAFTEPSVSRVWAVCDTQNPASGRVLEKAGFELEGKLKQWEVHPSISPTPRDCYCYAKTRVAY